MKIIVFHQVLCLLSVYAPQSGLREFVKCLFYYQLKAVTAMIPASEILIPCGDRNLHIGSTGSGYKEVDGGYMGMASQTLIVRVRGSWNMH